MPQDDDVNDRLQALTMEEERRFTPGDRNLTPLYAMSLWKCFARPYLALSFDQSTRSICFLNTYQHLIESMSFETVNRLRHEDAVLWTSGNYVISAKMEHVIADEGEITLHFKDGPYPLYGLSFGFVPGKCLEVDPQQVILISRMQGRVHESARIAQATKACGEITPQASLYCALLGIAAAVGITCIAGVATSNQICFNDQMRDLFTRAYDDFFQSILGYTRVDGFFISMLPAPVKPLEEVVRSHRRRTRIKRNAKAMIVETARRNWKALTAR